MRGCLVLLLVLSGAPAYAQLPMGIPSFCASPNVTATSANFSALGATADQKIVIPSGVTVTYDQNSSTRYDAICVQSGGLLTFGTSGTLRLKVNTLVVEEGGELRIGTSSSPFTGTATVEFDGALKNASTADTDPGQWGLGMLILGKIRVYGNARTRFVRLTAAPAAAATSVSLSSTPTGWLSGDDVVIPESQQRIYGGSIADAPTYQQYTSNPASVTDWGDRTTLSATVSTTTASLTGALAWPHSCGKDSAGTCVMYPHIANLSSNITFKSTNVSGDRGHVLFTHMADVDVRYALFKDLGRTTTDDLNCSLRTTGAASDPSDCTEGTGAWTVVGTNQKGRYAIHFHMVMGPTNVSDTGYQGTFIGNAIVDAKKWALTLHDTSYMLIQGNVIAYGRGPGFMMEDGDEHFNLIDGNMVTQQYSDQLPRGGTTDGSVGIGSGGREAAGFWMDGGTNNYFTDNVAAGLRDTTSQIVNEVGFKFHSVANAKTVHIPMYRGADVNTVGQYTSADVRTLPMLQFEGNEAYGMSSGMTTWHVGTDGFSDHFIQAASTVQSFTAWNVWSEGFYTYDHAYMTFDTLKVYADPARVGPGGPMGFKTGDYKANNITIQNSTFANMFVSVYLQSNDDLFTYKDSTSHGKTGVLIYGYATPGAGAAPHNWGSGTGIGANPGTSYRTIVINNVVHTHLGSGSLQTIFKQLDSPFGGDIYWQELPEVVQVVKYQGGTQDFEVYYDEQQTTDYAGGIFASCNQAAFAEIDGCVDNIRTHSSASRLRLRIRGDAFQAKGGMWDVPRDFRGLTHLAMSQNRPTVMAAVSIGLGR